MIVAEDNKHYIGLVRDATVDLPGDLTHRPLKWWTDCPDPTPYADPQDWARHDMECDMKRRRT